MNRPLTQAEAALVSRLWAEGRPSKVIAYEVARSESSVRAWTTKWRQAGATGLPRRRRVGPVQGPDGRIHVSGRQAAVAAGMSQKAMWLLMNTPGSGWRRVGEDRP